MLHIYTAPPHCEPHPPACSGLSAPRVHPRTQGEFGAWLLRALLQEPAAPLCLVSQHLLDGESNVEISPCPPGKQGKPSYDPALGCASEQG